MNHNEAASCHGLEQRAYKFYSNFPTREQVIEPLNLSSGESWDFAPYFRSQDLTLLAARLLLRPSRFLGLGDPLPRLRAHRALALRLREGDFRIRLPRLFPAREGRPDPVHLRLQFRKTSLGADRGVAPDVIRADVPSLSLCHRAGGYQHQGMFCNGWV
jgi:hypothetical protein